MEILENFAAFDLTHKLIELMKIYMWAFKVMVTLAQGHLHMKVKLAFLRNHLAISNQILNVSL